MRRGSYLTESKLTEIRQQLDEQDEHLMDVVGRFRLVSGRQFQRLSGNARPSTVRSMQRRTRRLVLWQVLDRLERRIGGVRAGSAGYVFQLGVAGKKLRDIDGRRTSGEPGERFVAHTLAITELYVELVESELLGQLKLVRFDPEPSSWRSYLGASGESRWLRPDAFCIVDRDGKRQFWFIEIDLATETMPTIGRKMARYHDYLVTGQEQRQLGGVFPRVLWHASGRAERSRQLAKAALSAKGPDGLHVTSGLIRPPP